MLKITLVLINVVLVVVLMVLVVVEAADSRRRRNTSTLVHFGKWKLIMMTFPECGSKFSCRNSRKLERADFKDAIFPTVTFKAATTSTTTSATVMILTNTGTIP